MTIKTVTAEPVLTEIVERLRREGLNASVEYPGYIAIEIEADRIWCVGDANEKWGGELTTADGSYVREYIESDVPRSVTDVETVAQGLMNALSAWDEKR